MLLLKGADLLNGAGCQSFDECGRRLFFIDVCVSDEFGGFTSFRVDCVRDEFDVLNVSDDLIWRRYEDVDRGSRWSLRDRMFLFSDPGVLEGEC